MMLEWFCSLILLLTLGSSGCEGGNVLVYPIEGSHWVNMNILIQALHSRGHNITIVRSSKSWYINEQSSYYSTITIPAQRSLDEEFIEQMLYQTIKRQRTFSNQISFLVLMLEMFDKFVEAHTIVSELASTMLEDKELMKSIKESHYDLVITDPCWGGGTILAKYLNLPLIYNVRWLPTGEAHFAIAPSPVSYIPITGSGLTDKMNFLQRVGNLLLHGISLFQNYFTIRPIYQKVCNKYLGSDSDFSMLMQSADLWLMRVDFVFEFPRPTMPNVVYMGGFQCKPAKPLPQELEEFVQSSGEHGVILMSLGTFVSKLPMEIAEDVAAAFGELPQKVIWRYTGERPATLGNNTLLVDWMPQNDLLGHPKMRVFVAHGGTNGVQEAMYHGVPVLGIPIFFDQYDNLLRLEKKGAAKILENDKLNEKDFLAALQEVLHEPSYRMNMQRLSRLHRDQPMKPLDRAMFWIEFVMRHKGAAHLRTESYRMPWFSYHSVDVVGFFLAAVLFVAVTIIYSVKYVCRVICTGQKVKTN